MDEIPTFKSRSCDLLLYCSFSIPCILAVCLPSPSLDRGSRDKSTLPHPHGIRYWRHRHADTTGSVSRVRHGRPQHTSSSFSAGVFNLWSADPRWSAGSFQGVRPWAIPEKLETRRILTEQKYRPYQCCRYRLQRTELKTSLVFAMPMSEV